jgi:hypothetical protein
LNVLQREIIGLENEKRQLQNESLPEETVELFDLAEKARSGHKYGAALRLLNEGNDEAYYLMEDLEEEEDDRRYDQVRRALEHYTDKIMGQVRDAFKRSAPDEWTGTISDDPEWDCPVSEDVTLMLAKAAAKEVEGKDPSSPWCRSLYLWRTSLVLCCMRHI